MKKLLVINSSARTFRSQSRRLTEVFVEHWRRVYADTRIRFRDLGNTNVPHINEKWIAAAFKPEAARSADESASLSLSNTYISELREADIIVLGAPMYNWSIPSALKAYIDQILRVNETWKVNPTDPLNPYVGLLENKTLVLLLSRGSQGYEPGGYNEHMNFQSTYLETVFAIIGIRDIHIVAINGVSSDRENLKESIDRSHQKVRDLIHDL
ncbi:FMN-dependent NADH-azoreductase [Dawidia soli]|uniref:FMN dependent NADH:quinone oxidoreductase n=1 Tax=Dawidia soli TaxID=2782352 RepID=A0AAP2D4R8_9BACT|nr:NAD(P)H-dependent oxidoreductase [Dawidia soli]MBT1685329.1 NAD(P)H-dependent oxidoreductase [Dawidia soli]